MKLDNIVFPKFDQVEAVDFIKVANRFVKTERKIRGQILWELDVNNGECNRAVIVSGKQTAVVGAGGQVQERAKDRVNMKKDHYYFWALNEKNALKKIRKMVEAYNKFVKLKPQTDETL